MDNHPIPQDVTGFQFKLVGNMTIKQFGYVGTGIIMAVIFYYAPIHWVFQMILVPFFSLTGLTIAFLPIEGRPFDLMVTNLMKALLHPNQFIYQKVGGSLSFNQLNLQAIATPAPSTTPGQTSQHTTPVAPQKEARLRAFLYNMSEQPHTAIDQKEAAFMQGLFNPSTSPKPLAETTPQIAQPQPLPAPIEPTLSPLPQAVTPPVVQLPSEPVTQAQPQPKIDEPQVQIQTTLPGFPNLISGNIKDSRGNVLSGILVDVKNKAGESVRAFKTNALGQFASATQLANGEYTIEFEDQKHEHTFSQVHLSANGSILPPITVTSVDKREELRQALFG